MLSFGARCFNVTVDGMNFEIVIAFLLCDAILACLLWLLLADEFDSLDRAMTRAELERDHAIDDWFRAQ